MWQPCQNDRGVIVGVIYPKQTGTNIVLSSQIIQTAYRRHITHNESLRELGFVSMTKVKPNSSLELLKEQLE